MKKTVLIISMFFFFLSAGEAKDSKEYTFMMAVINTLGYLQTVLDTEDKEGDNPTKIMSQAMLRNHRLTDAKITINAHSRSKDSDIRVVIQRFNVGIDLLMDGNYKLIKNVKKISNASKQDDLRNFQYEAAKIQAQNQEAWETIGKSASLTWPIFIEYAKTENPSGPIPFKIAPKERKNLIKEIDRMFSYKLNKFYQYRAAVESGREGNPNDQTWIIFCVYGIRKMLSAETYEEQMKRDFYL